MASSQVLTPLAKLKPRDFQAVICVRVVRKWNFTGRNENGPPLHVDLVLADAEGGVMYAEIPRNEIENKSPLLEPGKTYTISRFRVKAAKSSYMPFPATSMIELTCYTRIALAQNPVDTFPVYVQRVVPFNEIRQHVREHPDFIDVMGVIVKVDIPSPLRLPGRQDVSITRDIVIRDLNDKDLRVTLWGQRSKNFSVEDLYDRENPKAIVALFVGCVPKEFQKVVHVSGNNACHWYLNPPIQEAQQFYARFRDRCFPIELPIPPSTECMDSEETIIIEHKSLEELHALDPYHFPVSGFHCTVTITNIPCDDSWWYLGCRGCKKSSSEYVGGAPWCKACKTADFKPRYKLAFTGTDATAEGQFFCFDNIAQQIVKKTCESLFQLPSKTSGTPNALSAIVSNRFTFAVGLTTESYHSTSRTYLINAIVEDFQRQASSRPSITQHRSTNLVTHGTTAATTSASVQIHQTRSPLALPTAVSLASPVTPAQASSNVSDPSNTPPSAQQLLTLSSTDKTATGSKILDAPSHSDFIESTPDKGHKNVKRKILDDESIDDQQRQIPDEQSPIRSTDTPDTSGQKDKLPTYSQPAFAVQAKRSKVGDSDQPTKTSGRKDSSSQHKKT